MLQGAAVHESNHDEVQHSGVHEHYGRGRSWSARGLLVDGIDVPKVQRFDCGEAEVVLAMEYLGAVDPTYTEAEADWAGALGVFDTKPTNCRRRPDGTLVWIDLGFCDFYDPNGYDYF